MTNLLGTHPERFKYKNKVDYSNIDTFVIYMCVEGIATIISNEKQYNMHVGETLLIPRSVKTLKIESDEVKLLEVFYQ